MKNKIEIIGYHFKYTTYILLLFLPLYSCTYMTVTKVDNNTKNVKGIRYSLPKPFIKVSPSPEADGKFNVEVIYVPDQEETYAVNVRSILMKSKVTIKTENGLLKQIDYDGSSNDALVKAIETTGKVADEELTRKNEEREKQEEEVKTAAKSLNENINTKTKELAIAQAELNSLNTSLNPPLSAEEAEKVRLAELKIRTIEIELGLLQNSLGKQIGVNAAYNQTAESGKKIKVAGPVIYAIKEQYANGRTTTLELEAIKINGIDTQMSFETIETSNISSEPNPPKLSNPEKIEIIDFKNKSIYTFKRELTQPINEILELKLLTNPKPEKGEPKEILNKIKVKLDTSNKHLEFEVDKLAPGDYVLEFKVKGRTSDTPIPISLKLEIKK